MKKNFTQLAALALSIFVAGGPTAYAQERAVLPTAPQSIGINVVPSAALNVDVGAAAPTVLSAPAAPSQEQLPAALVQAPAPAVIAGPQAAQPRASAFGRLEQTVSAKDVAAAATQLFENAGRLPAFAQAFIAPPHTPLDLKPGVRLDSKPRPPKRGAVVTSRVHLSRNQSGEGADRPIALSADPSNPASIEAALRHLVDSNTDKYGASSDDMAKVHVQLIKGSAEQNQADTYYAVFRQWKKGVDHDGSPYYLLVDGSNLTFTVKVLDGQPVVMATEGRLYPNISSDIMQPGFSDEKLDEIAAQRLQSPPDQGSPSDDAQPARGKGRGRRRASLRKPIPFDAEDVPGEPQKPVFLTREIVNIKGGWRAVNIYQAADLQGQPVIVAVDIKSGQAFAWDARSLLRGGSLTGIAGQALAKGTTFSPTGDDHGPEAPMPLPYAKVFAGGHPVAVTAEDGSFTVPGEGDEPVKLTVKLDGQFAAVSDEDQAKNGPVEFSVTAKPGEKVTITLNADSDNLETSAAVNGYVYYTQQVAWLQKVLGTSDPRIVARLAGGVRANRHDMPGNAYYDPSTDSLNLQADAFVPVKARGQDGRIHRIKLHFENTAQPSIIFHESTHRAVQALSQIEVATEHMANKAYRFVQKIMDPVMEGGVNEAIADIVSMLMRGSPVIGNGFIIDAPEGAPQTIRDGNNTTQFDPKNDDPHARGEAFMGFGWKVRQAIVSALGEAAGAAYAALVLVPTTLYGQPQDVPTAMKHVLLASMTKDGQLPHQAAIRGAAQAHGVDLPAAPSAGR